MEENYPNDYNEQDNHMRNYMKICKKNDFGLISSISHEIESSKSFLDISKTYDVSIEEVKAIDFIMKCQLVTDNNDNNLEYIYKKYQLLKGGGKRSKKALAAVKGVFGSVKKAATPIAKQIAKDAKHTAQQVARDAAHSAVASASKSLGEIGDQSITKIIEQVKLAIIQEISHGSSAISKILIAQLEEKFIPRVKDMILAEISKLKLNQAGGKISAEDLEEMSFNDSDSSPDGDKKCGCAKK